jgi:hypothetical protein
MYYILKQQIKKKNSPSWYIFFPDRYVLTQILRILDTQITKITQQPPMFSPLEEDTIYQLFLKGISLSDTINKLKRYPFQVERLCLTGRTYILWVVT